MGKQVKTSSPARTLALLSLMTLRDTSSALIACC
jgi:hypothetical protein